MEPKILKKPFDLHVMVCTNTRGPGEKQSCGPLGAEVLRGELKTWLRNEIMSRPGLKLKARVNGSGCLDFCARGIVMAIYGSDDADFIVDLKSSDTEWVKARLREKLDAFQNQKA